MTEETQIDPPWRAKLREALMEGLDTFLGLCDAGGTDIEATDAVMAAVLPHMETSYRTGRMAGASASAKRLAQKNLALAAEVTELRCLNAELKKDLAAQRLLTAIEKSNRTAPTEAMVLAKELSKKLREAREHAQYHATKCTGWCCDHAPDLLKILGDES